MGMVSISAIAEFTGVSPRTVKKRCEDLRQEIRGKAICYESTEACHAIFKHGDKLDLAHERALLTIEQRKKVELERKRMERKLIPVDAVEHHWLSMIGAMRSRILSIPTKLAHAIIGVSTMAECREILKDAIHEALNELSNNGMPPPSEYEGGENATTAAKPDGKRVGRKIPKAKSRSKRGTRTVAN